MFLTTSADYDPHYVFESLTDAKDSWALSIHKLGKAEFTRLDDGRIQVHIGHDIHGFIWPIELQKAGTVIHL